MFGIAALQERLPPAFRPRGKGVGPAVCAAAAFIAAALSWTAARAEDGVTQMRILLGMEAPLKSFSADEENLGFQIAFREANGVGGIHGRQIEWLGYARDDARPDQAVANAKRLVEQDRVFALVNFGGPAAIPLAAYAEQQKAPLLFPHTALVDSTGKRYLFTSFPGYGGEAKVVFRYLAQERGLRRIGIVHDENVYGQFFRDRLAEHAAAFGYTVAGSAAVGTRNPEDLTREMRAASGTDADAVVMALYPAQARVLMSAKASLGWTGRMVSVGPLTDEAYLNLPGGTAEGTLGFCYYPDPERSDAPGVTAYRAALSQAEPGHAPNRYTMYGYVFGKLVVDGLRRAGPDLTREGFVSALEATRAWDSGGVLPPVTLTRDDHHAQTAGFLCEMKDGRFVPLSNWIAP